MSLLEAAIKDLEMIGDCRTCGSKDPFCEDNPDSCTGYKWRGANDTSKPLTLDELRGMDGEPVWVDFNQGLDVRLITPETAALLAGLHWIRFVRMSCDTSAILPVIEQAAAYLREAGVAPSRLWAYVLVQDVEDAHHRVIALDKMGITPFAQPYRDYDGGEPTIEQRKFARWVNAKSAFRSCTWPEYKQ